ncbi:energy transducer TonB [Beijerinckia mobilis]|uniref:energy transducer TonB n=1 Tax=Beijerinckia mobilis TaxID=231434 RepID=UPI0005575B5D|nr:energy transducer TonB [Beijerinckia mobilis]
MSKGNGLKIVTLPDSERASTGPGEETDDSSFEDLAADADKSLALSRTSLLSNMEGRRRWAFVLTLSALIHASLILPLLLFWTSVPADPEQAQKEVPVEVVTEEQVSPPSKPKSGQGKDDKPDSAKLMAEKAAKEAKEKEEKAKAQQAEKEKAEKDKAEQQKAAEAAEKKLEEKKEAEKQEAARKSEEEKAQATKNDLAKTESQKTEPPKSDSSKQETEKHEPSKQDSAKQEPPKQEAKPEQQAKKEPEKSEQQKPEPKKAETAKSEPAKSKQAPAKHQAKSAKAAESAARKEAARDESAKDDSAKSQGARAKAARNESGKTAAASARQNATARYAMAPTAQQKPLPPSQSTLDQALGRPGLGFDPDRFRAVAVPLPSEDGDELMSYKLIVFGLLERSKHYPETALQRGARGRAVVGFSLDEEGRVVDLELLKSSGEADLDVESLALVDRASPFPVPPPGAQRTFAAEIGFGVSSDDPDE